MAEGTIQKNGELLSRKLERLLFAVVGLLLVFAVLAQPELSLLAGFLQIQISETGLITDPMATGGVGAAHVLDGPRGNQFLGHGVVPPISPGV